LIQHGQEKNFGEALPHSRSQRIKVAEHNIGSQAHVWQRIGGTICRNEEIGTTAQIDQELARWNLPVGKNERVQKITLSSPRPLPKGKEQGVGSF
jgi:hypothetical protein